MKIRFVLLPFLFAFAVGLSACGKSEEPAAPDQPAQPGAPAEGSGTTSPSH